MTSAYNDNFFDTFEVMLFNKVASELLLLEKVLQITKNSSNEKDENLSSSKISVIWSSLNQLIISEKQEAEKNFSQSEMKNFSEVLFIMVSMIDEFFIRKDKGIAEFWSKNLFEVAFFNSRSSGSTIFERIEDIIENRVEKKRSVIFVYLLSLSLGFRGKYYGINKEKEIANYKRTLYSIIFQKSANSMDLMNNSFLSNNVDSGNLYNDKSSLVNNGKTYKISFILIVVYLILSYALYYNKQMPLEKIYNRLNTSLEFIEK